MAFGSENESETTMEGWLYIIRSNRFGLHFSRKRYFVLGDHLLKSFKSISDSKTKDAGRSAVIDSCIRVTDNGRESVHRKAFFIFTLYNTSNHNDQLKLGASSPEDAARWINLIKETALKGAPLPGDVFNCSRSRWDSLRLSSSARDHHTNSIDWTLRSSARVDPVTTDVVAPSPWTIFGCQNGLRLFKEAKERDSLGRWDDHPAIMAVGVVDGTSETIFQTLLSLGPSRSEWDFCFYQGSVVEHLDGHTDIIHKQLYSDWLPWGMKRRDFSLRRYWRREDDGTYVILYHSVFHKKCPPQKGYIRACLKTLRELFRTKNGSFPSTLSSGDVSRSARQNQNEDGAAFGDSSLGESELFKDTAHEERDKFHSERSSLVDLNDGVDEFFDVPEPSDNDNLDDSWTSDFDSDTYSQDSRQPKLNSASSLVKKLHDLAVQKRGYVDLHERGREESSTPCRYGTTLPTDPTCALPCSWSTTDPSTFLIRGKTYLEDQTKVKAKGTLMQMVAADWLKSDKREDDFGSRPGGIVQKYAAKGGPEFFFIVNIQVPGSTTYSLVLYYMMSTPIEEHPLLVSFVNGDDAYRNSRFKLIPYISKGSWIVKQSVGKKACLIGQALEMNYFRGKNYIELGVDIGSSTVARGVVSLVLGYLNNLVIEMAFLIQANTEEELPEYLLGTCRFNHLDATKAVSIIP